MATANAHTLKVRDYDDFRDSLPTSGVFDMTDCSVEIWCPEIAQVEEVERMVALIESMVHVNDVKVGSTVEDLLSEDYRVVITEVPNDIRKKYAR